ncbi:MAG: hypothetical protein H5T47_05705 [Archaeoglobi archaeon]|nr:hypothetical protein [Candidatus Mnemosynella bozhongmuii]
MTMNLDGNLSRIPKTGVSTLSDNLILLWNEFENGKMCRKLLVLKARGSDHSKKIHRYEITEGGIVIK